MSKQRRRRSGAPSRASGAEPASGRGSGRGGRADPAGFAHWLGEAAGVLLIAVAALAALALATYDPSDPVFRFTRVANGAGALGATVAALLFRALGWGAAPLVAAVAVVGARLILGRGLPSSRFLRGSALLVLGGATFPHLLAELVPSLGPRAGGWLGGRVGPAERALFGLWGGLLLNLGLAGFGLLAWFGIATVPALAVALRGLEAVGRALWAGLAWLGARFGRSVCAVSVHGVALARSVADALAGGLALAGRARQTFGVWRARRARRAAIAEPAVPAEESRGPLAVEGPAAPVPLPSRAAAGEPDIVDHRGARGAREPEQETFAFREGSRFDSYEPPDIGIFARPPETTRSFDRDSLIMNSRILEKKLADFGVTGRVVTVHPGPVITMYEFEPGSGVKVNRITSLGDDLALALRALSVRIIAPLPGKSVVGIEIPNPERDEVFIRDLLEAPSFRKSTSKLTLALGKDIFGNPVEADLTKMPHLLVAGATGTGKSVFLNALLCSILFRASPAELKLLLIDPKILELSIYEGIPHLIADVVTHPKRAAAALAGVVAKMEDRYQMMAALGVRNIEQFNARIEEMRADGLDHFRLKAKGDEEGESRPLDTLPYVVVVIDELADLMVVSARDVEESLQRLAQMARAAGIHLVLATQRPSVDVLTGVIKANFPSRISFQVSSRTDSRTILDHNGAEHLLGKGDMLFLPPGTSKLQRIHGAYVSEKEVAELVEHLRKQGAPAFDETLLRVREESEAKEERGEEVDDLYDRALAIVAESRNASISYLQRRLKVGYNRAARMIEQMELEGVVGPQEGTKPRDVYAQPIAE